MEVRVEHWFGFKALCFSYLSLLFLSCDARRTMLQSKEISSPKSSYMKHLKIFEVANNLNMVNDISLEYSSQPFVSSPLTLPPYDSLSPTPLPQYNSPPFCVYPPPPPPPPPPTPPPPPPQSPFEPIFSPPSGPIQTTPPPFSITPSPPTFLFGPPTSIPSPNIPSPSPTEPILSPPLGPIESTPPPFSITPSPPTFLFRPPTSIPSPIPSPTEPILSPPSGPIESTFPPFSITPSPPTFLYGPPTSIPSPIEPIFSPPTFFFGPPTSITSPNSPVQTPPYYEPSPPSGGYIPVPPVFQPPVVFPPPMALRPPPRTGGGGRIWCVAKPSVPDPILQEAMNYACGSGADCGPIEPNGLCFQPNSALAHASYAFNSYWQRTKVAGGTCEFGGIAMLVTIDPGSQGCHFMGN